MKDSITKNEPKDEKLSRIFKKMHKLNISNVLLSSAKNECLTKLLELHAKRRKKTPPSLVR